MVTWLHQHLTAARAAALAALLLSGLLLALAACSAPPAVPVAAPSPTPPAAPDPAAATPSDQPHAMIPHAVIPHAMIWVQADDARGQVRRVDFTAPISGLALLQQSGLSVITASFPWGTAVCAIGDVGCPAEECFCGGDTFWNYAAWDGAAWQSYPVGADQSVITQTGALEGWRWGAGEVTWADAARVHAAHAALNWLAAQQNPADGSFGGMSASVESLLAAGANGADAVPPALVDALVDYVTANAVDYSRGGVAAAGKLAVGLVAAGACWPGDTLTPSAYYSPTLGALAADAGPLAWGILGALALDEPMPAESVAYLRGLALPDGGWEWSPGWGRDTNSTGLAIQALIAAGTPADDPAIVSGLAYLAEAQTDSGGFPYDPGPDGTAPADVNSTAYAVQAMIAAGQDPTAAPWQQAAGGPWAFLLALQDDQGGVAWQPGQPANLMAAQQAIPALLGQPYPVRRAALPVCEAQ